MMMYRSLGKCDGRFDGVGDALLSYSRTQVCCCADVNVLRYHKVGIIDNYCRTHLLGHVYQLIHHSHRQFGITEVSAVRSSAEDDLEAELEP